MAPRRPQPGSTSYLINLRETELARWRDIAREHGISVRELIRRSVRQYQYPKDRPEEILSRIRPILEEYIK
jgi:hypothetical protein